MSDKRFVLKPGISLIIGILVASAVFFFTQQDILDVKDSDILYVKKGPVTPGIVHLSHTGGEEFSFFINVFITPKQGQDSVFTLLSDSINKISFFIRSNGIPGIQWNSKNPAPLNKACQGFPGDKLVSWNQWNHVGFVYKSGRVTTFVNGKKCRETLTSSKTIALSQLELLPGTHMDSTVKESFPGKATYPIFLAKALSLSHIQELLTDSRLYQKLTLKIFLLFLFGFLVSFFVLTRLLLPLFSLKSAGSKELNRVQRNVFFVYSIHFIFFLVFNPGYSAARYINLYFSNRRLWNPGVYFTFLVIIGSVFILAFVLEKITRAPARICFVYGSGVMSLLMFNIILCILPRFDHIYPFVFNGLFSFLFSMIVTAPNILGMHIVKVDDETRQAVQ